MTTLYSTFFQSPTSFLVVHMVCLHLQIESVRCLPWSSASLSQGLCRCAVFSLPLAISCWSLSTSWWDTLLIFRCGFGLARLLLQFCCFDCRELPHGAWSLYSWCRGELLASRWQRAIHLPTHAKMILVSSPTLPSDAFWPWRRLDLFFHSPCLGPKVGQARSFSHTVESHR